MLAAVLPLLNVNARVPVCGVVAWYNLAKLPEGVDRTPALMTLILRKRLRVQGRVHLRSLRAHAGVLPGDERLGARRCGQVPRGDAGGLEQAPQGLIGLLRGENFGKLVVHVSGS